MEAGSDTTSTVLHSIVLMLAAFPEAQKKAQEEMDRVVGSERIPTPDDWKELPYTQALVKEACMSASTSVRILTVV
jgi:cytochrome P450